MPSLSGLVQQIWLRSVGGTGVRITKYPVNAIGTALTCSGKTTGAYKFAAANANVKAVVAAATITTNFRIAGIGLDTPSASSIFVLRIGSGTGAGTAVQQIVETHFSTTIVTAVGTHAQMAQWFPYSPTVIADGTNDAILADATSNNAGADDTINVTALVATGIGT